MNQKLSIKEILLFLSLKRKLFLLQKKKNLIFNKLYLNKKNKNCVYFWAGCDLAISEGNFVIFDVDK